LWTSTISTVDQQFEMVISSVLFNTNRN